MASYSSTSSSKAKVTKVKPILRKKFTSSERNSLDLDRPAQEQGFGNYAGDVNVNRTVHDVTFTSTRRGYHTRSTSGASQFSTATTGSGQRNGSFVHPFQQTPRPYTPPAAKSYTASLSDREHSRDSVPLVEDEGEVEYHQRNVRSNSTFSTLTASYTPRESSDLPPLRIPTKSHSSSRLTHGNSMSNLHSVLSTVSSIDLASPTESLTPTSGFRSSMDKGFRIRSHSHADSGTRFETVHEARRAWEEREQAKADKLAQEEARAAEKRARRQEKVGRKSMTNDTMRSKSDPTVTHEKPEGLFSSDYHITSHQQPSHIFDDYSSHPHQKNEMSTKKKTQSTWMAFVIWFRTRLLRMKKH